MFAECNIQTTVVVSSDSACEYRYRVYGVITNEPIGALYHKIGQCIQAEIYQGYVAFHLGEEIPATEFVEGASDIAP